NKTMSAAGVTPAMTGPGWSLELRGGTRALTLTRAQLEAMDLSEQRLPIACVEGWTATRSWTGVPLAALAAAAGVPDATGVLVQSLQRGSRYATTSLSRDQL